MTDKYFICRVFELFCRTDIKPVHAIGSVIIQTKCLSVKVLGLLFQWLRSNSQCGHAAVLSKYEIKLDYFFLTLCVSFRAHLQG